MQGWIQSWVNDRPADQPSGGKVQTPERVGWGRCRSTGQPSQGWEGCPFRPPYLGRNRVIDEHTFLKLLGDVRSGTPHENQTPKKTPEAATPATPPTTSTPRRNSTAACPASPRWSFRSTRTVISEPRLRDGNSTTTRSSGLSARSTDGTRSFSTSPRTSSSGRRRPVTKSPSAGPSLTGSSSSRSRWPHALLPLFVRYTPRPRGDPISRSRAPTSPRGRSIKATACAPVSTLHRHSQPRCPDRPTCA